MNLPRVAVVGVIAALGGCDLVYDLERTSLSTACGAFGGTREVAFGDEMTGVHDLSFNARATRGFVLATVATAGGPRTGPVPVILVDDRWEYASTFETNWSSLVAQRAFVGRMARDNDVWVGQILTTPVPAYHVFHYYFTGDMWALRENTDVGMSTTADVVPGGELNEPVVGSTATTDFLPIFRTDHASFDRTVAIASRQATGVVWTVQDTATDAINVQHQPSSGALARTPEGRQVLVYAATPIGEKRGSDLFIAEKRDSVFLPGEPLTAFNSDDEEVEPWVSEDCSMITFRRAPRGADLVGEPPALAGGTIYMSTVE